MSKNKTILVTGANSGIGLAITELFLENNWNVIGISRNSNNLSKLDSKNLSIYELDITNYTNFKDLVDNLPLNDNIIDVIINNAGVAYYDTLENLPHKKIDEMLEVNIKGFTNTLEVLLPKLYNQKFGTIINISSLADRYPRPKSSIYAATKSYVKSISDSLRVESAKYNVRIMNVSPSMINTPMLQSIKKVDKGYIEAVEFAKLILMFVGIPQNINLRDIVVAPTEYEG